MAQDFDEDPQKTAEKIADYAVDKARRGRRETIAGVSEEHA
jgi:hypothetical protein